MFRSARNINIAEYGGRACGIVNISKDNTVIGCNFFRFFSKEFLVKSCLFCPVSIVFFLFKSLSNDVVSCGDFSIPSDKVSAICHHLVGAFP